MLSANICDSSGQIARLGLGEMRCTKSLPFSTGIKSAELKASFISRLTAVFRLITAMPVSYEAVLGLLLIVFF